MPRCHARQPASLKVRRREGARSKNAPPDLGEHIPEMGVIRTPAESPPGNYHKFRLGLRAVDGLNDVVES